MNRTGATAMRDRPHASPLAPLRALLALALAVAACGDVGLPVLGWDAGVGCAANSDCAGMPASARLATTASATSGAGSAGFHTTPLPKASAEAILATGMATGATASASTATRTRSTSPTS